MPPLLDTPRGQSGTINRNTGQFVDPYKPAPSAPVISAQGLKDAPQPMYVPPTPPATQAAGFDGLMQGLTDNFTADLTQRREQAQRSKEASGDALLKQMLGNEGEIGLTDELYKETVDPAEAELRDINAQMLAERQALVNKVKAIKENQGGLFGGALQDRIEEETSESNFNLANLAVQQFAAQGKYDSARQIADRAVAMRLEKQKQRNDILQFVYEQNKDEFTQAEQREFESKQADRNRVLEMQAYKMKAQFDEQIKQRDPLYQAQLQEARMKVAQAQKDAADTAALKITSPDQQREYLNRDIGIINDALSNDTGLQTSSGLIRGGLLGAFVEGGTFGILSAPYAAARKQDFLSQASYIVKNLTFDKIKELGDKGIKLTPISEKELKAMGDASNVLVSAARFDDQGNLTGFAMSEDKVRKQLQEIQTRYQNAVNDINASQYLADDDFSEINSL